MVLIWYCSMEASQSTPQTLVLDFGSGVVKSGFSSGNLPSLLIPTVIGRPRRPPAIPTGSHKDIYFGQEALDNRGDLSLIYPLNTSVTQFWDDIEDFLDFLFLEQIPNISTNTNVLIVDQPLSSRPYKEKLAQILFDEFNIQSISFQNSALLSVLATGEMNGTVIDCGDTVTTVASIYQGMFSSTSQRRMPFAGRNVTTRLSQLLMEAGYIFSSTAEMDLVREIKEQLCYVTPNLNTSITQLSTSSVSSRSFNLPDGSSIFLNTESFLATEPLFNPTLIGEDFTGIPQLISESISSCPTGVRATLSMSLLPVGGTSLLSGLNQRIEDELQKIHKNWTKITTKQPANREVLQWIGGSIVASMHSDTIKWITKHDWLLDGASSLFTTQ
ncbi:putative Actin, gamma [Blattamonas nauphoetae]|uniref:Actin, gamma n=1 Tax=Blattamonas nauphoetae TaxID=2049346 RepID=A0ABQ9YFX9_9EUKA|nr:putative Actin, gamma [Blattamonas nauphoetae]